MSLCLFHICLDRKARKKKERKKERKEGRRKERSKLTKKIRQRPQRFKAHKIPALKRKVDAKLTPN